MADPSEGELSSAKSTDRIRLLVVGIGGLGAVVVREAVKTGFQSVTMMDDKQWTNEERSAQFLIPREAKTPANRAESSIERAQTLNRRVEVHVETTRVAEIDDHYFENRWDAVVAAGLQLAEINKLNAICRRVGVKFFAGNVFGTFGYFFSDLSDRHVFKKPVRGINSTYGAKIENAVVRQLRFVPFEQVMTKRFTLYEFAEVSPWYYVARGSLKFASRAENRSFNVNDLTNIAETVNEEVALSCHRDKLKVPLSYIKMTLGPETPIICQVIGTMLSKEVIKAVTHFEEPYNNFYVFDPLASKGDIFCIAGE